MQSFIHLIVEVQQVSTGLFVFCYCLEFSLPQLRDKYEKLKTEAEELATAFVCKKKRKM